MIRDTDLPKPSSGQRSFGPVSYRCCLSAGLASLLAGLPPAQAAGPLPVPGGVFVTAGSALPPQISGATMNIKQLTPSVSLNWDRFDIDPGYTVNFAQPGASAIALNYIKQGDPAQIRGRLNANGEVWLLNQNGIVFGKDARVDVRGLVASTMNPTADALASGIAPPTTQGYSGPAFASVLDAGGKPLSKELSVEAGASITTNGANGRVFLFAPNVTNEGTITARDGQVAIAAGSEIYIRQPQTGSGLVVEVGKGGVVTNGAAANAEVKDPAALLGQVVADHGTATLVALSVNQLGRVSAGSAVRTNGTVRLLARNAPGAGGNTVTLDPVEGGRLTLGSNSVTAADPDPTDKATAVDASANQPGNVTLAGNAVIMRAGSSVTAHGGTVKAVANEQGDDALGLVADAPANSQSRVVMEAGARIDVSGTHATVDASRNSLTVKLQGAELKDLPVQRNGVLRGKTVTVDLRRQGTRVDGTSWIGTPLADLTSSAAADVNRGIAERNSAGGTVTLQSQGALLLAKGSSIDVSGGVVTYPAGSVQTTLLMREGRLVDIGHADPNVAYDGVYGDFERLHTKWGGKDSWSLFSDGSLLSSYSQAYTEGKDAGTISLLAPGMILDGRLLGSATPGSFQRKASTTVTIPVARAYDQLPLGGRLVLGNGAALTPDPQYITPDVRFGSDDVLAGLAGFDAATGTLPIAVKTIRLAPDSFGTGKLGALEIYSEGRIALPAGTHLDLGNQGSVKAVAGSIDVAGAITAPAGSVSLFARGTSDGAGGLPSTGVVSLVGSAAIDVSGLWTNDTPASNAGGMSSAPILPNGGSIELRAQARDEQRGGLFTAAGSALSAGGGAMLTRGGKVNAGKGGSISLAVQSGDAGTFPVPIALDGTMSAHAFAAGGTLKIGATDFCVAAACGAGDAFGLDLDPGFFARGGFASYVLTATGGGFDLAAGTTLRLRQENLVLDAGYADHASGDTLGNFTTPAVLGDMLRQATSLSVAVKAQDRVNTFDDAKLARSGLLSLGAGSAILADPLANVLLASDTRLHADGTILAPGGNISLALTSGISGSRLLGFLPSQTLWLGSGAVLDASGTFVATPNNRGLAFGTIVGGGSVSLAADSGYVVAEPGARIDVRGAVHALDVVPAGTSRPEHRALAGDSGSISVRAAEGFALRADLLGAAAAPGARAGKLELAVDAQHRSDDANQPADLLGLPIGARTLEVDAAEGAWPAGLAAGEAVPADLLGRGIIAESRLAAGGFGDITLKARNYSRDSGAISAPGSIVLGAATSLAANRRLVLDAAGITIGGTVSLAAPYLALGNSDDNAAGDILDPQAVPALAAGSGTLTAAAAQIDFIGALRLNGVSRATFTSSGDIRLRGVQTQGGATLDTHYTGSLESNGDLSFASRQLYPATLTEFTIAVRDNAAGRIRFDSTAAPGTALSAGGQLRVVAPYIEQAGAIEAPLGLIALDAGTDLSLAPGSLTSTSLGGAETLFGQIEVGKDWVYLLNGFKDGSQGRLVFTPQTGRDADPFPGAKVLLQGPAVHLAAGATVDESGGGDLLAYEFQPGLTGSVDALAIAHAPNTYAIVPRLDASFAPYDPQEMRGFTPAAGESVELAAGAPGLAAGRYALLPPRFALLPGAFLVTQVSGYSDLAAGSAIGIAAGGTVIAGRRVFATGLDGDSRSSGFLVRDAADIAQLAKYDVARANDFAALAGQRLPRDGGILQIAAGSTLDLGGHLLATPGAGGRGAEAEFTGGRLAIVNDAAHLAAQPGTLLIDAAGLAGLGAESLVIGGTRHDTAGGRVLDVSAEDVTIAGGVNLTAPEIILAATDEVKVASSVRLVGAGAAGGAADRLLVNGDGALLRVASGPQVTLVRSGGTGATGALDIAAGATLAATGAMLLDASTQTQLDGTLAMHGGSLNLGAARITLGSPAFATDGLVLNDALLGALDVDELVLTAREAIDLHGGLDLAFSRLVFEAPGLGGYANDGETARVTAKSVRFGNAGGFAYVPPAGATAGHGTLAISTSDIAFGQTDGGGFGIGGFDAVTLSASGSVQGTASGSFTVDGTLATRAAWYGAAAGATTKIAATGAVSLTSPAGAALPAAGGLGGALEFTGSSIVTNGHFALPAGRLALHATGAAADDDVTLGSGAVFDVAGRALAFGSTTASAPAGSMSLVSDHGDIAVLADTAISIDLAGSAAGGDAGALSLAAPAGRVTGFEAATLTAGARAGARQGSLALDVGSLADPAAFGDLLAKFSAAGFEQAIAARVRSGSLALGAGRKIVAQDIALVADAGDLAIARDLDASGASGGNIRLAASGLIAITGGTTLAAHATTAGGRGGAITIETAGSGDGTIAAGGILVDAGATLDVSAGTGGQGGTLGFRLPRADLGTLKDADATNDLLAMRGTLLGSASTVVEGFRAYSDADGSIAAGETATTGSTSGKVSAAASSTSIPTNLTATANGLYAGLTIRFTSGNLNGRTATITAYDSATKRLSVSGLGGTPSLNSQFVISGNAYYTDAVAFMSDATAIEVGLGSVSAATTFHLRPGLEIRSAGVDAADPASDLALDALWDLSAWRFNGEPGMLTLRAAGNLNLNDSLSDGFNGTADIAKTLSTAGRTTRCANPASCSARPTALPRFLGGDSWSYRLVAGADLASADTLATASAGTLAASRDGVGNLTIAGGTVSSGTALRPIPVAVRTGTGSIEIAAGGSLALTNRAAVIYTAGLDAGVGVALGNASPTSRGTLQGRPYPERGGDIRIVTGGSVDGIAPGTDFASAAADYERQLVTSWLFRQGDIGANNRATGWTIAPEYFEQGIGALAGGRLSVKAGGDLNDVSLSVASIGRQIGGTTAKASVVEVIGGGTLDVTAGGSILSGVFYVGQGSASLRAGGDVTSGRPASDTGSDPLYSVLALGDARLDIRAGGRIDLGGVVNPTLLAQGPAQRQVGINAKFNSYFFTYAPTSAVTLEALTGDVAIHDTTPLTSSAFEIPFSGFDGVGLSVLPPGLSAIALTGNVVSDASFALYPSASGNFALLAGGSVEILKSFALADADVSVLPGIRSPLALNGTAEQTLVQTLLTTEVNAADPTLTFAQTPVHLIHDTTPARVVALTGDVTSAAGARLFSSRPAEIVAGRDLVNLDVIIQNTLATDVSILDAGRDLVYSSPRVATDSALGAPGALLPTANTTEVWGPGRLLIETGRNVELGTAGGILSRGSTKNAALAGEGAAVTLFTGLNGAAPDFAAFTHDYLGTASPEFGALSAYVRAVTGDSLLAGDAALAAFEALPSGAQAGLVLEAFFRELRASGRAAAASTSPDYRRGDKAIATLFSGDNYRGDVNLYFSGIFTLGGGNIDLLVPGGYVNVGLATPPSSFGIPKGASELGIVTEGLGDIRSYLARDFEVNESRVFAADGGSILVWSGHGDIDAGRGAKSAISVPANGFQFDNQGHLTVTVPPPIQGSGIRALTTTPGREFGSVDLVTPQGVVNASEAGIESAGNITIAAVQVLGAENIKAGGNSVGVPTAAVGGISASVAGAGSAASSAAKAASDAAAGGADRSAASTQPLAAPNLSVISVEVLGFGA